MPAKTTSTTRKKLSSFLRPQEKALEKTARCAIAENGALLYGNDSFLKLTELTIGQLPQKNALDIFTFADQNIRSLSALKKLPSGTHEIVLQGQEKKQKFRFDWVNGPDRTRYLIASFVETDEEKPSKGEISRLLSRLQTRRKPASIPTELIDRRDLQQFTALAHDIMIVADEGGKILRTNRAFLKVLGYAPEDLTTLNLEDLFTGRDKHFALTKPSAEPFEARMKTAGGESRWMECRRKETSKQIYILARDITEFKHKQRDLMNRERELSETETIARMGHWYWKVGKEDITWSAEIFRIFGLNPKYFKPGINHMTDMVHKRDVGRTMQVFQRAIIEKKNYDMEFRITRPDGETRYLLCEGRCEKDSEGEVVALYGILQDLTERITNERALREAKNAAEAAYAAKSRFLANMSHELRTPLNAIIGFSDVIDKQIMGPVGNEKYLEYARGIKESGEHLLSLITDILDMSKIEAGKYTLDLEEINVGSVMNQAMRMIYNKAHEKRIKLIVPDRESENIILVADRRATLQILLNLLSNAVKFTPKNGTITLECTQKRDSITLKVTDTGIGIPPGKLATVTRPFEQASTDYTKEHEGTGLGLAITKALTDLHKGTLSIESKVGKGTIVTVRLPKQ